MRDPSFESFSCDTCLEHEVENSEFRNCLLYFEPHEFKNPAFSFQPKWIAPEEDDDGFQSCPLSIVLSDDVSDWIEMWKNLKEFNLPPSAGGQFDQDDHVMRCMRVIQDENNRIDSEEYKTEDKDV